MQFSVSRMQVTGIITVPYCSEKDFLVDHAARKEDLRCGVSKFW